MPPKKEDAGQDKNIMVLIHLLTSATDFKVDTSNLSTKLGLAQAKNCGRTINAVIGPYGYEFRGGKVVPKHESPVNHAPKTAKESATSEEPSDVTSKKPSKKRARPGKAGAEAEESRSTTVKKQKTTRVEEEQKSEEEDTAEEEDEEV